MTTPYGAADLLAALDGLAADLSPATVAETLRGVPVDPRALAPYLLRRDGCYTRNLIARRAAYELIAIHWAPGAVSAIHDHAEQDCGLIVVAGALHCEDWFCTAGGTEPGPCTIRRTGATTLGPGQLDVRSGTLSLHRIASDGGAAISLHVYHAPIDRCLNYDEAGTCDYAVARYDSVATA